MDCRLSPEELSAFVDGELDWERSRQVTAHLKECAHCRMLVESLRSVSSTLGMAAAIDPEPRLRAGLARRLAMLDESPSFTCAQMQIWLSARLDGELPGEQARQLQEHLAACAACASEAAALGSLVSTVRSLAEVAPPLGLERSILTAISSRQRRWVPRWVTEGLFLPRLSPGLATAAAAAMLIAGFWLGRTYQPGATPAGPPPTTASKPHQHYIQADRPVPANPVGTLVKDSSHHELANRPKRHPVLPPSWRPAPLTEAFVTPPAPVVPPTPRAGRIPGSTHPDRRSVEPIPTPNPTPSNPPSVAPPVAPEDVHTPVPPAPPAEVAIAVERPTHTPDAAKPDTVAEKPRLFLPPLVLGSSDYRPARPKSHARDWWAKGKQELDSVGAALNTAQEPQPRAVMARIGVIRFN